MNRETIFAIVFGILLGVGVGFFVLFQTTKGNKAKVIPVAQDGSKKPVAKLTATKDQTILAVSAPQNNIVVTTREVTIQGKAPAKSLIVIQSAVGNTILKTEKEDFSAKVKLALGENIINISAYSSASTPQETTLAVYSVDE